jgi:hypothetical protein
MYERLTNLVTFGHVNTLLAYNNDIDDMMTKTDKVSEEKGVLT